MKGYLAVRRLWESCFLVGSFLFEWGFFPLLAIGDFRIALRKCGLCVKNHY